MGTVDRVAFVAVPPHDHERSGQGSLDAEAAAERLGQEDARFHVVRVDAKEDVASQIDVRAVGGEDAAAIFYASARAVASEGELVLQLDDRHLETADALADVALAVLEAVRGPVLIVLDLRSNAPDALARAELAELARSTIKALRGERAVEIIAAVRTTTIDEDRAAGRCSPFTGALLAELDETDPDEGIYASELVERVERSS
ncbi:MAG: hypothetical protein U0271_07790 [Polyangiaceae bacterium]